MFHVEHSAAIRRARLGSARKCCPRALAGRSPWRAASSVSARRPNDNCPERLMRLAYHGGRGRAGPRCGMPGGGAARSSRRARSSWPRGDASTVSGRRPRGPSPAPRRPRTARSERSPFGPGREAHVPIALGDRAGAPAIRHPDTRVRTSPRGRLDVLSTTLESAYSLGTTARLGRLPRRADRPSKRAKRSKGSTSSANLRDGPPTAIGGPGRRRGRSLP